MFGKLIKHDVLSLFRQIRKLMLVSTLSVIVSIVLTCIVNNYYAGFGVILFFLTIGIQMAAVIIISLIRTEKTLFGAEGYLTHSLPVSGTQLYFSKVLSTFLFLGIMAVISVAEVTFFMGNPFNGWPNGMEKMLQLFSEIFNSVATRPGAQLFLVSVVVSLLSLVATILFSIAISNEAPFHRWSGNAAGVGVFVLTTIALQCLSLLVMKHLPLNLSVTELAGGTQHIGMTWGQNMGVMVSVNADGAGVVREYSVNNIILNVLATVLFSWRTIHSLNHKISLR